MATGGLIRHIAGALAIVIALVIVVPTLVSLIRAQSPPHARLPVDRSGELAAQTSKQPAEVPSGWQGFGVFCAWTVEPLVARGWLLVKRDA